MPRGLTVTPRPARTGLVLVSVLLVAALVWAVLAGLLVIVRLQFEVAVAARDHAVARSAAENLIESARSHDWWAADLPAVTWTSSDGQCLWSFEPLEVADDHAWYAVEVVVGRASVRIDATAHRRR